MNSDTENALRAVQIVFLSQNCTESGPVIGSADSMVGAIRLAGESGYSVIDNDNGGCCEVIYSVYGSCDCYSITVKPE